MENFFYIQSNRDWIYKYKFGITSNPKNRINSDQHPYKTFYKKLFKYNLTDDYRLNYNQIDKIVSIISRNKDYINQLIEEFDYNFKNLIDIRKYLVNPVAIKLIEANQNKIIWNLLSGNPSIFELDYEAMKKNNEMLYEDLIKEVMKPSRVFKERDYDYIEVLFGD